jgi:hypothetical protein
METIRPHNWVSAAQLLQNTEPETEYPLKLDDEDISGLDVAFDLHSRFDAARMGHEVFDNTIDWILDGKLVLIDSKNEKVCCCPMKFKNIKL